MSNNYKLSLWQKIKRLLTSRAPQDIINPVDAADIKAANTASDPLTTKETATDSMPKAMEASRSNTASQTTARKNKNAANTAANNAKVSLVKKSATNRNETPIIDCLKLYFRNKQWHYTYYKPRLSDSQRSHYLSLRMKNRKIDCGYLFRVQEKEGLLAVYGILPFLIPESHQSAAMLLITQINYDMIVGNLEMDVNDGEIRYKNALDVEVVGLDEDIIEHLLQSVVAMTTVAYEVFGDLINTQEPSDDMPTLLGELRQQADARTFFLASKKMQ